MRTLRLLAMGLGVALVLVAFGGRVQAAFPEYVDQNSEATYLHSGISTRDGITIWDNMFAPMVRNPWPIWNPLQFEEMAFGFMQCYGGGMIDELELAALGPTSYTSAARHNEKAWAGTRDAASGGKRESYYNLHYSPWVGGATVNRHDQAGQNAYNNDLVGPVINNPLPGFPIENPQYFFNYPFMDRTDITLHQPNIGGETPDTYLAILWGGSVKTWANYNSLARIHSDLIARGYTNDEIYMLYPGNTKPNGTALPGSWEVDDGTNFQDMVDAWQWANLNSDAATQIYFWSSIAHGTDDYDVVDDVWDEFGAEIQPGTEYDFNLEADFVAQITELFFFFEGTPEEAAGQPYFQVIAPELIGDLSVSLNSEPLALLEVIDYNVFENDGISTAWEEDRYQYKFGLDSLDIANLLVTGNTFEFTWSGGLIDFKMAGLTTGDMANAIPEPTSLMLLAVGGVALLRRRRR